MNCRAGPSIALVGVLIVVCSLIGGYLGAVGASLHEHWGELQACFGLAFLGGTVGIVVFCIGMGKTIPPHEKPLSKHLCPGCGCREADGAKTCRWCGADQE